MKLKMQQYTSPRYPALDTYCQIPSDHPKYLEPPFKCQDDGCHYCVLYKDTRDWIESCYHAQHQPNSMQISKGTN